MLASPQFVASLARIRASTRPSPRFRFVAVGRSGRWFRVVPVLPWWRVWGWSFVASVLACVGLVVVVVSVFGWLVFALFVVGALVHQC